MAIPVLSDIEFKADVNLTADSVLLLSGSAGTAGQVLESAGPGAPPVWATPSGGGGGIDPVIAAMIF